MARYNNPYFAVIIKRRQGQANPSPRFKWVNTEQFRHLFILFTSQILVMY